MSLRSFSIPRPRQLSEVLKFEVHQDYSRDTGTALAGEAFELGQVIAEVTASGKLVVLDPAATDGSQTAVGVALQEVEAGTDDVEGVLYAARGSLVSASGLRWPAGIAAAAQAAAVAALVALGIVVRDY